jgi:hypothetical protein
MNNEIKQGDPVIWAKVFEDMPPLIRRWAFIAAKMAEHKMTFSAMATRHRLTGTYISNCAQGKVPMSPRVVTALESDLKIDLTPFLTPTEIWKNRRVKKFMPKEEEI